MHYIACTQQGHVCVHLCAAVAPGQVCQAINRKWVTKSIRVHEMDALRRSKRLSLRCLGGRHNRSVLAGRKQSARWKISETGSRRINSHRKLDFVPDFVARQKWHGAFGSASVSLSNSHAGFILQLINLYLFSTFIY